MTYQALAYLVLLLIACGVLYWAYRKLREYEDIMVSTYIVVGDLLQATKRWDDPDGQRVLDMLSNMKYDPEVIPWRSLYLTVTSTQKDGRRPFLVSWQDEDHRIEHIVWERDHEMEPNK